MPSESYVYLAKDYIFQLTSLSSQGWMARKFKPKDVNLMGGSYSSGTSSHIYDLEQYIKARSADYALLTFAARIRKTDFYRTDFDVEFNEQFMKSLCSTFPNRFIRIKGKVLVSGSPPDTASFDKRFEIKDLLEGFSLDQRLIGAVECRSGSFTCDIIVGWSENAKTIPISVRNLETSFDELTIVAGNGAEIPCPREAFEALFGERIEMLENSEEGIRHLVRYICNSNRGLDTSQLSSEVAVELFKTSSKYKLTKLQDSLGQFLLRRGSDWYTADALLELYLHAKADNWKSFQDHALSIMQSSTAEVRRSRRYKELSSDDALELAWRLCDFKFKKV